MRAYSELKRHFYAIGTLGEIDALLSWDMETMMPAGGHEARAEQVALLETHIHSLTRDPRMGDWFARAADEALDANDRASLREMQRRWVLANAVDDRLVDAFSRARSKCSMVWRQAKADGDFAMVEPYLEHVMQLVGEQADARAHVLGCSRYDALLAGYDPDITEAGITVLFDQLAEFLPSLTRQVIERQAREPAALPLTTPIAADAQRRAAARIMQMLGFDFNRGRLDESIHPFCGGIPDDVRITTNYDATAVLAGLLGVVHETGHALYEQGLPVAWRRLPAGAARSMTLHESQSLLYEMQLGCGPDFLRQLAPILRDECGVQGPEWSVDNLVRVSTRVTPGAIRIRADEVTYPAHIVLRFRLERALMDGSLRVRELPEAWRAGMQELLAVTPASDAEGVLQDIHWFEGLVGYFPTYTLGALAAAQLFESAGAQPDIRTGLDAGDFSPLQGWLRHAVHRHGSLRDGGTILEQATGAPLGVAAFRRHLERRYLGVTS